MIEHLSLVTALYLKSQKPDSQVENDNHYVHFVLYTNI